MLFKNDYAQTNRGKVLNIVDRFGTTPFLSARAHYINGVGYYENDSVVEACQEYLKAMEIMEDHYKDKELVGHKGTLNVIGGKFDMIGQLDSADYYSTLAIGCVNDSSGLMYSKMKIMAYLFKEHEKNHVCTIKPLHSH